LPVGVAAQAVIARVKMQGHIVLQNSPTLMKAITLVMPVVNMPTSCAAMPHTAKYSSMRDGLPLLAKVAMIIRTITGA
jgi:hypothetical protein